MSISDTMSRYYYDPDFDPIPPHKEPFYNIINIDNNDLVETFDTVEDAREFINIHPDAELLAILHVTNDGAEFID